MPSFSVYFEFSAGDEVFYVKHDTIRTVKIIRAGYSSDTDNTFYDVMFMDDEKKLYGVKEELLYGSFDDVIHNSQWSDRITVKGGATFTPVDEVEVGMKCFYECQSTKSMVPVVITYTPNGKKSVYLCVKAVNDNVEIFNEDGDNNFKHDEKIICVRAKDIYKSI